jgi:hypothetical protein
MSNKQSMKLYTEEELRKHLYNHSDEFFERLTPIELPSDEEIEEKLNVAYGNGYEQGEMDFYKKMKGQGNEYADGYAEGYQRALELVKFQIVEQLEARR